MALSNEMIEKMLNDLKENQVEMRKEYNDRIDKLEAKFDSGIESIRQEIKEQTIEQNNTFVSRVEFQYQQDRIKSLEEGRNKIIWILITAIIGAVLSLVLVHN